MPISPEVYSELVLQAMVLASVADGVRPAEEDRVALGIHALAAGVRLDEADYERVCAAVAADPEAAWRWLGERQGELSLGQREEIVRAVVRVAMADAELQDEEVGVFRRIGRVLDLGGADVRRLMNQVWREERATEPPTERRPPTGRPGR